jgi:hypothetical protein
MMMSFWPELIAWTAAASETSPNGMPPARVLRTAGRGQDARDVNAVFLEQTLLHRDRIGHAVELPAPMGDGDGLGLRGRSFPGGDGGGQAQH